MGERKVFDSNDVMAYILGVCEDNGISWNATKAQKLMYCCYGTVLAAFGEKLTEEAPQAWQYGPVFPRTFNGLKKNRITPGVDHGFSEECNQEWLPIIEQTVKAFGNFTASELSTWSHAPGSPWAKATNGGKELLVQIPASFIAEYFEPMINRHDESGKQYATTNG